LEKDILNMLKISKFHPTLGNVFTTSKTVPKHNKCLLDINPYPLDMYGRYSIHSIIKERIKSRMCFRESGRVPRREGSSDEARPP
jgi:hypothetical protein